MTRSGECKRSSSRSFSGCAFWFSGSCGLLTRWSTSGRSSSTLHGLLRPSSSTCVPGCAYGASVAPRPAPVALRLRRLRLGARCEGHPRAFSPSWVCSLLVLLRSVGASMPLVDCTWSLDHGLRELLDGLHELVHQPDDGGLATGGIDHRAVADLRSDPAWPPSSTSPPICVGRRSACSPCSATRGKRRHVLAPALEWRREHFHTARRGRVSRPPQPAVASFLQQARAFYFQQTGDPGVAGDGLAGGSENLRQQQAASLAYFDVFWLFGNRAFGLIVLVPLMKRSVAEQGEHVRAE